MKKIKLTIVSLLTVVAAICASVSMIGALSHTQVPNNLGEQKIQHNIAYVGGGVAPYSEQGVTYYNAGNILELTLSLPANSYAVAFREYVIYDLNQLELVTSFNEIKQTLGAEFYNEGWSMFVSRLNGNNNEICLAGSSYSYLESVNVSGGTLAKMRFRVKEKAAEAIATNMNITFSYQLAGVTNTGQTLYIHAGYDANNDASTYMVSAPTISLMAHKTPNITPIEPTPEIPSKPGKVPEIEYNPSQIVEKEIDGEKLAKIKAITMKRDYSYMSTTEWVNGKNTYQAIAQKLIDNLLKDEDKVKFMSLQFQDPVIHASAKINTSDPTCYTHYIYIGASFLMIFITYGYKKYLEAHQKVKWRS